MATESVWDQSAYNEEQFYVSHNGYTTPGVSSRVMNHLCFMNTKVLFRYVREDPELYAKLRPVSVHVNYHPEKPQRMVDIHAQYHDGVPNAIGKWNWGEGMKIAKECNDRYSESESRSKAASSPLGKKMMARAGLWGSGGSVRFLENGKLDTPWGPGKWGALKKEGTFYADFIGAQHMLTVEEWPTMKSKRCSDGEEVEVKFE
eukprot:CAMPEP_0197851992 /NCGR_PEP_ID=MMETSP1438-20131217/19411_1 /TAXON_ID=1461541 /ORGANISM="Pterosperma sp., Strain CCMP1384" /LENGTH=202 /DNA_ID=CAMNT_0043465821 /DNA_START=46 /DNA_END=654 /DNA_ORIENTATION=-